MEQDLKKIGICIKSQSGIVSFQNDSCIDQCGNQIGKSCEKGCMLRYKKCEAGPVFDQGVKQFKNVKTDIQIVDAVMINDGENLTTFLYKKEEAIQEQLKYFEQFHLSKSELKVMKYFLFGYSNQDIATQLFISRATLRTHLNNIYKKIPERFKFEIISSHLGKEIQKKT